MKESFTTNKGAPVLDDQHSFTVSKNVPLWIQDVHLIEKLSYFNREQIPEQAAGAPKAELY